MSACKDGAALGSCAALFVFVAAWLVAFLLTVRPYQFPSSHPAASQVDAECNESPARRSRGGTDGAHLRYPWRRKDGATLHP